MSAAHIMAADLFCGAGGTSTGLALACQELNRKLRLLAINHWQVAIDTHTTNHPHATHLCESLDSVDPRKIVPAGRLKIMIASPECTHHSNARGGRPMSDQSRASAWHILRWAEALYIENILIENVKEFRSWGPLGADGRPIKRLKGQLYMQLLNSLRALGYNVEDRVLNAADYGDPTTRERLFIIARRGRPVTWPEPTHAPGGRTVRGGEMLENKFHPWRTAREIIDWRLQGESIFTRKRPLAEKTIQRIIAGLKKFGGANAEPFLVVLRNHGAGRSVDVPVPALTAGGTHVGLCQPQPFVIPQQSKGAARSVDKPLPTVATKGAIAVVDPFLVAVNHGEDVKSKGRSSRRTRSVDEPLNTVTTKRNVGLVEPHIEPFLLNIDHQGGNGQQIRPVDSPVATQTTKARTALIEPFIVPQFGERDGQAPRTHSVDDPLPTVTGHGAGALVEPVVEPVEPFLLAHPRPNEKGADSVDKPLRTVTAQSSDFAVVNPFLVKYNGTAKARPVESPLDTVSTKDRFALVTTAAGQFYVDIRFRMLQPHELARAQGFADSYEFKGNREEVVKQIGNAVPVHLAKALCRTILSDAPRARGNGRTVSLAKAV